MVKSSTTTWAPGKNLTIPIFVYFSLAYYLVV